MTSVLSAVARNSHDAHPQRIEKNEWEMQRHKKMCIKNYLTWTARTARVSVFRVQTTDGQLTEERCMHENDKCHEIISTFEDASAKFPLFPQSTCIHYKILLLIKRTRFRSLSLTSCRSFRFSLGIYSFSFPSSVATDLLSVLFRLSIRVFALISFTLSHNFVLNIRKLSANWFSLHTFRVVVVVWSLCVLLDVISLSSVRHRSSISHERSTSQVAQRDSFFWYLRACIPRWALTRPISAAAWAARAHRDSVKIELIDGEESEKHFDQIWQIRFVSAVRQPSAITRLERPFNKNNWTKSIEVDYCVISIE